MIPLKPGIVSLQVCQQGRDDSKSRDDYSSSNRSNTSKIRDVQNGKETRNIVQALVQQFYFFKKLSEYGKSNVYKGRSPITILVLFWVFFLSPVKISGKWNSLESTQLSCFIKREYFTNGMKYMRKMSIFIFWYLAKHSLTLSKDYSQNAQKLVLRSFHTFLSVQCWSF